MIKYRNIEFEEAEKKKIANRIGNIQKKTSLSRNIDVPYMN